MISFCKCDRCGYLESIEPKDIHQEGRKNRPAIEDVETLPGAELQASRIPEFQNCIQPCVAEARFDTASFMTTFRIRSLVDLLANLFEDCLS